MSRWQFVLHQQALEEIDKLRPAERCEVRSVLLRLTEDPETRRANSAGERSRLSGKESSLRPDRLLARRIRARGLYRASRANLG
jgi:hypothetical protein